MDTDKLVELKVETLTGIGLRYALATALELTFTVRPPVYGLGYRILVTGEPDFFRPEISWVQGGPLVETHWRETTAWLSEHFGPNWRDRVDGKSGRLLFWLCRGIVGARLGDTVQVPEYLLVQ